MERTGSQPGHGRTSAPTPIQRLLHTSAIFMLNALTRRRDEADDKPVDLVVDGVEPSDFKGEGFKTKVEKDFARPGKGDDRGCAPRVPDERDLHEA